MKSFLRETKKALTGALTMTKAERKETNMSRELVDKRLYIRVTESELAVIEERLKRSCFTSMSAYLRQQIVHGIYLEYDHDELRQIRRACMNVANNINQITIRVNSTNHIYKEDLNEIKEGVNELWRQLQSIQSVLLKLNPSSI